VDRLMAMARGRSRPSFGKALRSDMRIALSSFGELSVGPGRARDQLVV
jgi:hypothetical protein